MVRAIQPNAAITTETRLDECGDVEAVVVIVQYPDLRVREYRLDCDGTGGIPPTNTFRLVTETHIDDSDHFPLTLAGLDRSIQVGSWCASLERLPSGE